MMHYAQDLRSNTDIPPASQRTVPVIALKSIKEAPSPRRQPDLKPV